MEAPAAQLVPELTSSGIAPERPPMETHGAQAVPAPTSHGIASERQAEEVRSVQAEPEPTSCGIPLECRPMTLGFLKRMLAEEPWATPAEALAALERAGGLLHPARRSLRALSAQLQAEAMADLGTTVSRPAARPDGAAAA